jgi:SAM-dependent methyltransferase
MASFFTNQRNKLANAYGHLNPYWKISPLTYGNYIGIKNELLLCVRGRVLDAGAGNLTAKPLLTRMSESYFSLDIEKRNVDVDILDDIQTLSSIKDNSFETVYSSQVLEHIPRPWDAVKQIYRVLKKGGYAVVTVPHLSALHEEPYDFYRYTPHSLNYLFSREGFHVVKIKKMAGLLSFVFHPVSMFLVLSCWPIPIIRWLMLYTNFFLIVLPVVYMDKMLRLEKKFPANLLIIAKK